MTLTQGQIEEIRQGNIKAFELLFAEYYHKVRAFAFGMLKNEQEADEVAQVVFTKIWICRDRLVPSLSLTNYIFTIARNEVNDFFRQSFYLKNFRDVYLIHNKESLYEIDNEIDVKQMRGMLDDVIAEMPAQRQKIFIMSRKRFMTNEEIAAALGISKRTVEKHISLALATIREKLGEFMLWAIIFLFQY